MVFKLFYFDSISFTDQTSVWGKSGPLEFVNEADSRVCLDVLGCGSESKVHSKERFLLKK